MSVGQLSLDSLTEDKNPPIKCAWRSRPACGRCGVWLSKGEVDDTGHYRTVVETACAHCGQVNRLD
jgi:hypothetical protein